MNYSEEIDYAALDFDKETRSSAGAKSLVAPTFRATIKSPSDATEAHFSANTFTYESLTEKTISVIGRYQAANVIEQVAIVLPRNIEDGEYSVAPPEQNGVHIVLVLNGAIAHATKGTITIKRKSNNQIFEAIFDAEVERSEPKYKVTHGIVTLEATGPL